MLKPTLARYSTVFLVVSLAWGASWLGSVQSVVTQDGPTPTLRSADYFLYPLPHPTWGSYSNNRYGVQNQHLSGSSCFVNIQDTRVPRNQLYHAGSDWFHKPDLNAGA
ncbi:MAG: hypothetical protein NZM11_13285, partial [Anaerolineales bacterium]|nr:hypothetical protein [Anaerolineales bacterium]